MKKNQWTKALFSLSNIGCFKVDLTTLKLPVNLFTEPTEIIVVRICNEIHKVLTKVVSSAEFHRNEHKRQLR